MKIFNDKSSNFPVSKCDRHFEKKLVNEVNPKLSFLAFSIVKFIPVRIYILIIHR